MDVSLAQLNERAKRCHTAPGQSKTLTRQGVEDDVDASAVGGGHDAFYETLVAAGEDVVRLYAETFDEPSLLFATHRNEYDGSYHLAQRDRGLAETTGTRVDEYSLALLEPSHVDERMVRGAVRDRQCCSHLMLPVIWDLGYELLLSADDGLEGAELASGDTITDLVSSDGLADRDDVTADFAAQWLVLRYLSETDHDIAEVEAGSFDFDLDTIIIQRCLESLIVNEDDAIQKSGRRKLCTQHPAVVAKGSFGWLRTRSCSTQGVAYRTVVHKARNEYLSTLYFVLCVYGGNDLMWREKYVFIDPANERSRLRVW